MNPFMHSSIGNKRYQATILALGIGHGFSDAAAGFLIGSLPNEDGHIQTGMAVLVYNLLAFGGQLPAGIWLDRIGQYRQWAVLSLLGMILALGLLLGQSYWLAIVIAGLSSAVFHVAGGAVTLSSFPGKSRFIGLFSAFGVIGLALGGWAGSMQQRNVGYLLLAGLTITLFVVWKSRFPLTRKPDVSTLHAPLDTHDYLMILLLVAIALRSAVWNVAQLLYLHQYDWLIYMALAAMAGKLMGGWLTDRIPLKVYALFALTIAIPALGWGYRKLFWLLLGTGLLQSLTPVSVAALHRLLPNRPATATGATFGLAIALGGLFSMRITPSFFSPLVLPGLLTGAAYYWFLASEKRLSSLT